MHEASSLKASIFNKLEQQSAENTSADKLSLEAFNGQMEKLKPGVGGFKKPIGEVEQEMDGICKGSKGELSEKDLAILIENKLAKAAVEKTIAIKESSTAYIDFSVTESAYSALKTKNGSTHLEQRKK